MADSILNVVGIKVDPKPAQKGSDEVRKSLDGVKKSALSVKSVLATAFAAVSVSSAIREFAEYDQQLRNVATVAGATESELAKLNKTALDLALGTRFNPQEVAQGMYSLVSAGQKVEEVISTLPNVLDLAEAAQADLGVTTELVTSTLAQFGLEADQSGRVVDTFTASIANSATNVPRLQVAMANSGSTAKAMNQEFESSVAVLSLLTTAFGNGEKAGTGYKSLLNQLATNGEKLGISVSDAAGNMRPLVEILDDIKDAGIPATELMKTFGTEAGPSLAVLLEQGSGAILKMRDNLLSNGQAAETAAKQLDTLQGDWDQLMSTISVASIQAVDAIEPVLRVMVQTLNEAIQGLMSFFSVSGGGVDEVYDLAEANGVLLESLTAISEHQVRDQLHQIRDAMAVLKEEIKDETFEMEAFGLSAEEAATRLDKEYSTLKLLETQFGTLKERLIEIVQVNNEFNESNLSNDETMVSLSKTTESFIETLTEKTEILQAEIDVLNGNTSALDDYNKAQALSIAKTEQEKVAIAKLYDEYVKLKNEKQKVLVNQDKFNKALTVAGAIAGKSSKGINQSSDAIKKLSDQAGKAADTIEDLRLDQAFEGFAESLNPALAALGQFKDEIALINEMTESGKFTAGQQAFYSTGLAAEFALNSMANMAQEGSDAQRKLAAAAAITNTVLGVAAILEQGKGDPYTAFARMAAMAATVASLGVQVSGAFGGGGAGSAEQRQARQGTGSVLGYENQKSESISNALDLIAETNEKIVGINSRMLRSLDSMNDAISGTVNQIAKTGEIGNLGTTTSTSLGGFDSFLFGGSKITDRGIELLGGSISDAINGDIFQAYEIAKKKGLFGSSRRINTAALDEGITNQISLIFESMNEAVLAGAEALGVDVAAVQQALDNYQIAEQRISLMDLSPEEQQAELQAVFSSIFDGLVGVSLPFISQFQVAGEGLGETLARVSTTVLVFEEAIESMGLDFIAKELDPELFAQAAVSISEFAGGMDEFVDGYSGFIRNFLSETEQQEILAGRLGGIFEDLGLAIPGTRDEFKELIRSFDLTTEAGQQAFGTLISFQGEIHQFYTGLENLANSGLSDAMEALRGLADDLADSQLTLNDRLNQNWRSTNDLISAFDGAADSEQRIIDSLQQRYEMEFNFIEQIRSASESINGMLANTRESIELSLLDDQGQYNYFRERAETLAEMLQTMTDPEQISATVAQINDYTNQAYGLLNDGQRQAMAPEFLQFLDDIGITSDMRLGELENEATNQTEQLLARIEQMQIDNAEAEASNQAQFAENVEYMRQTVQMMEQVVNNFSQVRIPVDVYYRDAYEVGNL